MKANCKAENKILLVEDDPLAREALAYILEFEGYSVTTAPDGKKGLDLLRSSPPPRAVLLDLGLPFVDGQEFLRRQKRDPEIADVPVIVITATFAPVVPEATAVLLKPLDLPKLMGLLAECRTTNRSHQRAN